MLTASRLIVEFGHDRGWTPEPGSRHSFVLQAQVHPSEQSSTPALARTGRPAHGGAWLGLRLVTSCPLHTLRAARV
jgi:hypothetical protein